MATGPEVQARWLTPTGTESPGKMNPRPARGESISEDVAVLEPQIDLFGGKTQVRTNYEVGIPVSPDSHPTRPVHSPRTQTIQVRPNSPQIHKGNPVPLEILLEGPRAEKVKAQFRI